MATSSTINIQKENLIQGIYCHYDGFPEGGVGEVLLANYKTTEKVEELIELGDIRYIGPTIKDTKSYHNWDRIEVGIIIKSFKETKEVDTEQYNYLWRDNMWWMSEGNNTWIPLDQIIMK